MIPKAETPTKKKMKKIESFHQCIICGKEVWSMRELQDHAIQEHNLKGRTKKVPKKANY